MLTRTTNKTKFFYPIGPTDEDGYFNLTNNSTKNMLKSLGRNNFDLFGKSFQLLYLFEFELAFYFFQIQILRHVLESFWE